MSDFIKNRLRELSGWFTGHDFLTVNSLASDEYRVEDYLLRNFIATGELLFLHFKKETYFIHSEEFQIILRDNQLDRLFSETNKIGFFTSDDILDNWPNTDEYWSDGWKINEYCKENNLLHIESDEVIYFIHPEEFNTLLSKDQIDRQMYEDRDWHLKYI